MMEAREELQIRKDLEKQLYRHILNRTDPSSYHQQVTTLVPEMLDSDSAVLAETSVRLLLAKEEVAVEELESIDASSLLNQWSHCSMKKTKMRCPSYAKFRTLDGSCNNILHPSQGASLQPFRRILPPVYDDKFASPRTKSVTAIGLASAREISRRFTTTAVISNENKLSMLFLSWGQFIAHDMTNIGSTKGSEYLII